MSHKASRCFLLFIVVIYLVTCRATGKCLNILQPARWRAKRQLLFVRGRLS
jgi:hypothetical protein